MRKGPLQISLREDYRPRPDIIRQAVHLGVPSFLERATISVGQICTTAMITGLGTAAIAANAIGNTMAGLAVLPGNGIALGMVTVVGQCMGAGRKDEARYYIKKLTS